MRNIFYPGITYVPKFPTSTGDFHIILVFHCECNSQVTFNLIPLTFIESKVLYVLL
jgi:hypothetical protein